MIKLLFFEIKKLLRIKGIQISIVVVVLCMFLNGINNTGILSGLNKNVLYEKEEINTYPDKEKLMKHLNGLYYSEQQYEDMYIEYAGLYDGSDTPNADKKGKYGLAQKYDKDIYGTAFEQMDYFRAFDKDVDELIVNAKQIKENNQNLGKYSDLYKDKELSKMINAYTNVKKNVKLKLCYTTTAYWYAFTESEGANKFNYQLIIFFICCIISVYFANEYESGIHEMTFVTFRGRYNIFVIKNIVVLIVSFLISLMSCISNIIVLIIRFGGIREALWQPIQLIYDKEAFAEFCPFNITFGQYILLAFVMKFTALYFAACFVVFITVLLRKGILSISMSALFLIGLLQITIYAGQDDIGLLMVKSSGLYKAFSYLRTFSPISLLWSRKYVDSFDVVNLFGFPIYRISFALIFSWVLILILFVINTFLYCKRGRVHEFRVEGYIKEVWEKRSLT